MVHAGLMAAFGTALCWSWSAIFFETAARKTSPLAVNFWKVLFAFVFLVLLAFLRQGPLLPFHTPGRTWAVLSLSGVFGFLLADYFLFHAYVMIGARVTVIFQSLTPLFTAFLAFLFLGERMRPLSYLAMLVVISGILLVVSARHQAEPSNACNKDQRLQNKGYIFAFCYAFFQACGLILSKVGLGNSYDVVLGTQIRIMVAIVGFGLQLFLFSKEKHLFHRLYQDKSALHNTVGGAIFGPFLGVVLSLFALQHAPTGAASTLMALTPVVIIPFSIYVLKQKVLVGEIIGAGLAVTGAALFFIV